MPVIFKFQNEKDLIAIWQISEVEQNEFANLTPESSLNQRFRNKRQIQRNACLKLVSLFSADDQEIMYDNFGKPHLVKGTQHISFSHSGDFAAMMLSSKYAGVDFELIRPKVLNIIHKFMNTNELNSLKDNTSVNQAHVYWGAKEALYKVYGKQELIFKKHILIEPFSYNFNKGYFNAELNAPEMKQKFKLYYEVMKGYMLVFVAND